MNPYEPPKAEITTTVSTASSKKGWKVYFWIFLFLEILSTIDIITPPIEEEFITRRVLGIFIYVFVLVGVGGFAYNKPFLSKFFWQCFLPLVIIWDLFYIYQEIIPLLEFEMTFEIYFLIPLSMVILILMLIQYYALYSYGYNNDPLWES